MKKLWSLKEVLESAQSGKLSLFEVALRSYYEEYRENAEPTIIDLLYHQRFLEAFEKYPKLFDSTVLSAGDRKIIRNLTTLKDFILKGETQQ